MEQKYLEFEKPLQAIERSIEHLKARKKNALADTAKEAARLQQELAEKTRTIFAGLTPWQKVQLARHPNRPHALDYIGMLFEGFIELHGDRVHGDDPAIVAGIAQFEGMPVAVVGQQKGRDVKENLERKFGMAHPEGYRKALRVMKLAEKLAIPTVSLVDTSGANCDIEAEERGQAYFIADNLLEMARLRSPILAIVIGEGGSGGALGIAVGDRVLMQEYAIYSVISPEGCASILWKNQQAVEDAAKALKLTAAELHGLGLIDEVVAEPAGGAHRDWKTAAANLSQAVNRHLRELKTVNVATLPDLRYQKYRKMGAFLEKEEEHEQ